MRSRVYVVTKDKAAWQLAGVNEGWRNMWDGRQQTRETTEPLTSA